ncbi:uncharacterized protein BXIN_2268 [Babesia sp. Xinjiang]|uniref:uncharacterized protein n=1 Tax=Babesia sp. Xinjiang TaxID=462227 RepID=UPI000A25E4A5|nr:uncharacterized protein BXIN_2268 [Babesia sp. Xinjiang]ORM40812.1 hypothetical protein BXIN_2268 [Babesia sp. Xinjiang]
MLGKSALPVLCQLSCLLLGLSANLISAFINLDEYLYLRYLGIGDLEAQTIWYFVRRLNLFIAVVVILGILLFGYANKKTVSEWSWMLFRLYAVLLGYIYYHRDTGPQFNAILRWITLGISLVSHVLQSISIFYVFDPNAPGGTAETHLRLMFYLLGSAASGFFMRLIVCLSHNSKTINTPELMPMLLHKIVVAFFLISLIASLVTTGLTEYLWKGTDNQYLSLTVGCTKTLLAEHDDWGIMILTSLGWALTPLSGIFASFMAIRTSLDENNRITTIHYAIFGFIALIAVIIAKAISQGHTQQLDCDSEKLKDALFNYLNARAPCEDNMTNNEVDKSMNTHAADRHVYRRVFRDTQPWALLPYGYWDEWHDADYDNNKWMTQYLKMYIMLGQAKGELANTDMDDCVENYQQTTANRYTLLLEVKDICRWSLSSFAHKHAELDKELDRKMECLDIPANRYCVAKELICLWRKASTCKRELEKFDCNNCVYADVGLLRSSLQFMRGTLQCCVEDAKKICTDLGKSKILNYKPDDANETLIQEAIAELERVLLTAFNLMLMRTLAEEWLMLCRSMEASHRTLTTLLNKHSKQSVSTNTAPTASTSTPAQRAATNGEQASTSQTTTTESSAATTAPKPKEKLCCGCGLFDKLVKCVAQLHKLQCEMVTLMCNAGLTELKYKMPTICHTRGIMLLMTHYEEVAKPQNATQSANNQAKTDTSWYCTRYNAHLDSLLSEFLSDLEKLIHGDRLLYCAVSWVADYKKNELMIPKINIKPLSLTRSFLSGLIHRATVMGWKLLGVVMTDSKFEYEKQCCDCKDDKCECADCKNPLCTCNKNKPVTTDKCEKTITDCATAQSSCKSTCAATTAGTTGTSSNCGCQKVPLSSTCSSCDDISKLSALTDCKVPIGDVLGCVSTLLHESCAYYCEFIKATWCNTNSCTAQSNTSTNGHSVMSNIYNFSGFLSSLKAHCQKVPDCKSEGKSCVNAVMCSLLRCLFTKSTSSLTSSSTSQCNCNEPKCIGCSLAMCSKVANEQCCYLSCCFTQQVCDGVKCLSEFSSNTKECMSSICGNVRCIKETAACISTLASCVQQLYQCITCKLCKMIECAKQNVCKLTTCLQSIVEKQKENIKKLVSSCNRIRGQLFSLEQRYEAYSYALEHQDRSLGKNSVLMTNIGTFISDLRSRTSATKKHLHTTRRSAYMKSVKYLICNLYNRQSRGATVPKENLIGISSWFNAAVLLIFFCYCLGVDIRFYFGVVRGLISYNLFGMIAAIMSPILVVVGLTLMSKMTYNGGYFVNVALMLGFVFAIIASWFSQSYAHRSYIAEQFVKYYKNYRTMYPDYVDQPLIRTRWWADGFRNLVKADFIALWNLFAFGNMVDKKDIYNLYLSPRIQVYPTTKLDVRRLWPVVRATHHIKSVVLKDMKENLDKFFDFAALSMLNTIYWNFMTDIGVNNDVTYPLDLLWEGWTSGTVVTKGHSAVYDSRMEALDAFSRSVASAVDKKEIKRGATEELLLAFQKKQLGGMAKKSVALPFIPDVPRFPQQRDALMELFVQEYRGLWSDMNVTRASSSDGAAAIDETTKMELDDTKASGYNLQDLKQSCDGWETRKLQICKEAYNNDKRCLALVKSTAHRFANFIASLDDKTAYADERRLFEAYEQYCEKVEYENKYEESNIPTAKPILHSRMVSEIRQMTHINAKSPWNDVLTALERLVTLEDELVEAQKKQQKYVFGEWVRLNGVSVTAGNVAIMSNVADR